MKEREEKAQERSRKPGSKAPKAPESGPQAKDQANFTNGDSRIMPTESGPSAKLRTGFEQAYNARVSVDIATMLIVSQRVSQNPNDQ